MLRSVLNQYGTLFVPYIPKCPIEVCHTNVNAEYNDNEQNKTHGNIKESKTILARGNEDIQRTPLPVREHKHCAAQLGFVPVCRAACLPACLLVRSAVSYGGRKVRFGALCEFSRAVWVF